MAAADLGFRTAFVAPPTEYGPDQAAELTAENDYDLAAGSMIDLAARLGS